MIFITSQISLGDHEVDISATTAQGPGGQHVNKTSSAIQLRFDIRNSSLPATVKQRLLKQADQRINKDGIVVIKAQDARSQLRNREEAIERLREMIVEATKIPKRRVPTRPKKSAVKKRLDTKTKRGQKKQLRGPIRDE